MIFSGHWLLLNEWRRQRCLLQHAQTKFGAVHQLNQFHAFAMFLWSLLHPVLHTRSGQRVNRVVSHFYVTFKPGCCTSRIFSFYSRSTICDPIIVNYVELQVNYGLVVTGNTAAAPVLAQLFMTAWREPDYSVVDGLGEAPTTLFATLVAYQYDLTDSRCMPISETLWLLALALGLIVARGKPH